MSKGVAVGFKDSFGGVEDLLAQNVSSGGVGVLKRGDRFIFYLVTKEWFVHSMRALDGVIARLRC